MGKGHPSAPGRLSGSGLIILGAVVNINLGPLVPEPEVITGKPQIFGNALIILLGLVNGLADKSFLGVLVIDYEMSAFSSSQPLSSKAKEEIENPKIRIKNDNPKLKNFRK